MMSDLELGPDFSPVFIPRTVTESIRCLPTEVDDTHTRDGSLAPPPPSSPTSGTGRGCQVEGQVLGGR